MSENKYRVRLIPVASLISGSDVSSVRSAQVSFAATPTFSENQTVEYEAMTPVHLPGGIQVYKHSNSRTFSIGAKLYSRNVADAIANIDILQKLRTWTKPYFGLTDTLTDQNRSARQQATVDMTTQSVNDRVQQGTQLRGAPPEVLYLYAYSSHDNDSRAGDYSYTPINVNRVPVVITSLDIIYPDDVDYIPVYDTKAGVNQYTQPFPKRVDVTISVTETHSPREYEQFDLAAFKSGTLLSF